MSETGPFFHAWCPDNERDAAYAAALSGLLSRKWWSDPQTSEELVEQARASFANAKSLNDYRRLQLLSGHVLNFDMEVCRDTYEYAHEADGSPLVLQPEHQYDMLFLEMPIARGSKRSVEIESAIFTIVTSEDSIDLLQRLCAPDETSPVTTGACTWDWWKSPLDACITYHADTNVARDVALAWLNSYDETPTWRRAGLGLDVLRARIAAATAPRAQVAQASMVEFVEKASVTIPRWSGPGAWRMEFPPPAAHELTREQVLAVLDTPPAKLLDALQASTVPDAEWRAVEPLALENIRAKQQGAPCDNVAVRSRRHLRFLEQHAPFHVRRLPNGGVMLATHPYRTLWPLWADALALLGIRPR